jgi:hypothetical protein
MPLLLLIYARDWALAVTLQLTSKTQQKNKHRQQSSRKGLEKHGRRCVVDLTMIPPEGNCEGLKWLDYKSEKKANTFFYREPKQILEP